MPQQHQPATPAECCQDAAERTIIICMPGIFGTTTPNLGIPVSQRELEAEREECLLRRVGLSPSAHTPLLFTPHPPEKRWGSGGAKKTFFALRETTG